MLRSLVGSEMCIRDSQRSTLSDNPAKLKNVVTYPRPERSREQSGKYHTRLDCYISYEQKLEFKGYHSRRKKMNKIVYVPQSRAMEVFCYFHGQVSQRHVHPNAYNFLVRVPDPPRTRLRAGSRRMNSHRGKRSSPPLSSSRYMLFIASCARV